MQKKVIKERRLKERQKTAGETLQARFKEKTDSGERVIILEGKVKAKTRELSTLQKQYETTCETQEQEIQLLLQKRDLQAQVLSVCLYIIYFLFIVSSNLLLSLSKENERSITKLETVIQKEKVGKQAAQTEEAVAWGLLIHTQEQLQALKDEGQVCNRVRVRSSLLFSFLLIITLLGILILLFCLKLGIHDNNERCA